MTKLNEILIRVWWYSLNKVGLLGMIVWIDKILLGVLSLELLGLCWHMPLHEKMVDL